MNIKNNKGISIIILIITIILMILITSMAVFYSNYIAPEARLAAAYTSLVTIRDACTGALNEITIDPSLDEFDFFGNTVKKNMPATELDDLARRCGLVSGNDFGDRTYKISNDKDPENQRRLEAMEIRGITQTFVVDLDKDKYYLVNGVKKADNTIVYEYKDVMASYTMLTTTH